MLLLAGTEKSGKSYEAAKFSGSALLGRTFWVQIGEGEGHHYGAVPGANYELVPHQGTYRDILDAIRWAVWQPRGEDGKPNAIVVDSVTILWELLGDEQAIIARRRAAERAAKQKTPAPDPTDFTITTDQWAVAKRRWAQVIDALRHHDGPVILCARLDEVTVFDAAGQPTKERFFKVQAEKKLPFEVTGSIHLRGYRRAYLTGIRTLRMNIAPDQSTPYPGFSLDKLMRDLGLDELPTTPRNYVAPQPEAYIEEYDAEAARLADRQTHSRQARQQAAMGQLPDSDDVAEAIRLAFESEGDKRLALIAVRAHYGASTLAQIAVITPWGRMEANTAIEKALEGLQPPPEKDAGEGSSTTSPASADSAAPALSPTPSPPADEPRPELADSAPGQKADTLAAATQTPALAAPPSQLANPPRPPTAERARANLIKEVEFQAKLLGLDALKYVADLLPEGATSVGDIQGSLRLQEHIVCHRPEVLAALVKNKMTATAEQYTKLGSRAPAPNIGEIVQGALQVVG
ncbi:AAA family ATPase [Streptomyces sp. NPDC002812]|uniref:AAA family ATPase n=1 Tax=Streptomyces sp. NPDC002812 TaxID=3154434 RepID=UPI003318D82F